MTIIEHKIYELYKINKDFLLIWIATDNFRNLFNDHDYTESPTFNESPKEIYGILQPQLKKISENNKDFFRTNEGNRYFKFGPFEYSRQGCPYEFHIISAEIQHYMNILKQFKK